MSDTRLRTMWSVKYALTKGILEFEADVDGDYAYHGRPGMGVQHKIGRDAFYDRAEAVQAAEQMREKKVDALRRQIARLERIRF